MTTAARERTSAEITADLEQAVLSAMLSGDKEAARTLADLLTSHAFETERHQRLFDAMLAIHGRGDVVDPLTLSAELSARGHLEVAGGKDYIGYLIDAVPTAANAEYHARLLRKAADRRGLALALSRAQDALRDERLDSSGIATQLLRTVQNLTAPDPQFVAECFSLRQLYENPAMLRPPEALIPRLVYRGRSTMLSAREKAGKSTLAAFATAAASSGGNIFGHRGAPLRILLVGLEEHLGDVTQRFRRFGANGDRVFVVPSLGGTTERFAALEEVIKTVRPDVVVIDTLPAFAEGMVDDPNNPASWTPIMLRLTQLARDYNLGMLILHHARKSDGRYRDSTAIGAGVDMILEMIDDAEGSPERQIRAKGRWQLDDYRVRFDAAAGLFDIVAGGQASLETRVLDFIRANPSVSKNRLRDGVGGRREDLDAVVKALLGRGLILNIGGANAHSYVADSLGVDMVGAHSGARSQENGKSLRGKGGAHLGNTPYSPEPNTGGSGGMVPGNAGPGPVTEAPAVLPADGGIPWQPEEPAPWH